MKNNRYIIKLLLVSLIMALNVPMTMSQIRVCGFIKNCEGEALYYAGVSIRKSKLEITSDINGFYEIMVPDTNSVLTYRYIGTISQSIKVGNKDTINVFLKDDIRPTEMEGVMMKKPVIYLYPQAETEISVTLNYKGKLLFTYPEYHDGWKVIAYPNGTLKNKTDNKTFSYLFWDGEKQYTEQERTYETGYIVHKDSTVTFLQQKLAECGLQPQEYNEFIVFWTPYLQKNRWNFIHFRIGKAYETISTNSVIPAPDTEIRVFMDFKKVDKPFEITPQQLTAPIRNGFTLVEWGGSELTQPLKIQTKEGKYIQQ